MAPTPDTRPSLVFEETIAAINARLPPNSPLSSPQVGIICGSGLGGLASSMREVVKIGYEDLAGFAKSTVQGHAGALAFGFIGKENVPAVAMLGRLHFYEGHSLQDVTYPVRVMVRLGIKQIIITNAAGALNPAIEAGSIVVVRDHLALPSLTSSNPLLGPLTASSNPSSPFPRFLPLSSAYSTALQRLAHLASHDLSSANSSSPRVVLEEGTYAWVSGPTYETPAEGRFLRAAGADVVGMSTVPEVVVAKEEGVEVLVLSLVTNAVVIPDGYRSIREEVEAELAGKKVQMQEMPSVSHDEVLEMGKAKADVMRQLVELIVDRISLEGKVVQ
ncbi:nucleoside phosphorylase domain-containing protein [Pterulicium gracile]|uniref:purine-nucleoside phosphorylase n=1 Tax=Pterulicium gracile TaxID=1884261 RepID=A0A5C3Q2P6_9AGAR|nr:nucleoside phosphorylase domain-containing protein [Pterula gracilis]